jgi:hypothetical protein
LGLRLNGATDDQIERAFTDGAILRTHVMRPTWHFVTPADIRWIIELTAPRVNAANAYMYRKLELDDALLQRSNAAISKSLEGGQQLTRAELGSVLAQAGIAADGMRLGYIVHRAESDAVVCSGARRGKQFTYALLDERAPQAKMLKPDEALAELTLRYFTSHGPATVKDFSWWSGLTVADVKAGLQMVKSQLTHEVIEGETYWISASAPAAKESSVTAFFLPTYDEYIIGYTDRSALFEASPPKTLDAGDNSALDSTTAIPASRSATLFQQSARGSILFDSTIVIDGKIAGSWRRTFSKGAAVIESAPLRPFAASEREAVAAAAQRLSEFLGMPAVLA